ncbi:ShlB/FhaC/HecB family hemolysin secretion/activation protein [Rhodoferax lacus]|uniref:ShlB/FhaC/HecB family hemolysin secretion/activation protein n=1 Tax=Rhodoferax lacus TaxID=2184758 RepID=A0A3E1R6T5_9BURK|nr:ShlB/FhaC/HecB family hemolysin secretion/activation protein [Rhodoferax lacus]RFO95076.1 ShlB/FhaC/HecB family hemolysin secretion/activation protein [Rhodoferax lacus]
MTTCTTSSLNAYKAAAPAWPGILVCALLAWDAAQAQVAPGAGALRQQIERERVRDEPPKQPQFTIPQTTEGMGPDSREVVTVSGFRFTGNTLLSNAQLLGVVQPYLNRPLRFEELRAAAAAVAASYREAGWVARAFLPRQDVAGGEVHIQIVEAVFSGANTSGPEPVRLKMSNVLAIAAANLKEGAPLNVAAVERVLLLADDLPGVSVSGALSEGTADGQTALVLKFTDQPLLSADVQMDNQGARSTGSERIILSAKLNSPLGLGDRLSGDVLHSEGSDYVRLAYSVPVTANGLRVGVNASQFNYRLTSAEFSALQASGNSEGAGLEASYPLIRSRWQNLSMGLAYDRRRYHNEANQEVQSDYQIDDLSLVLSGNLHDALGGGGYNTASLSLVSGALDYGNLDLAENTTLAKSFQKWGYHLKRIQTITPSLSLLASLGGQITDQRLDAAEGFYLGGANGVRAYPANEGAGDQGQLVNLDLRLALPQGFLLSGFYDTGHVNSRKSDYSLSGFGLSLGWKGPYGATLLATVAQRIGRNPNRTVTGRDQDGSLETTRWWLQLSVPF